MGWITHFDQAPDTTRNQHTTTQYPVNSGFGLLTQNTRGFREESRPLWLAAWKAQIAGTNINYYLIQETHVGSEAEARVLQDQWAQAWGRQHDPDRPLSFWSIADSASIGVAILIRPSLEEHFQRLEIVEDSGRVLAISSDRTTIINIYAPNDRAARELFFGDLERAIGPRPGTVLLAGDFNCVLDPIADRISGRLHSRRAESPALSTLIDRLRLVDTTARHRTEDQPEQRLTYFQAHTGSGARLDRCYISADSQDWVTGTQVTVPKVHSDHSTFVTWLRDPAIQARTRPLPPLLYPIRGRFQDVLDAEIEGELSRILTASVQLHRPWDDTLRHIEDALRAIKKREKRRARRAVLKWERRLRRRIRTREDLIDYENGRLIRQMLRRRGARLLAAFAAQSITDRLNYQPRPIIKAMDGPSELSIANKFGHAWGHLLTTSHATCFGVEQRERVRRLLTVPSRHRLTATDNSGLMKAVSSEEVAATIKNLGAHKAGGADRLNNDFYRAWAELVAPALAAEFNRILSGGAMPPSFTEAIIVPLPKNGNSPNAMDYRPISLLQSSYKILTKLLAARVQLSLGRVINADQNGFVRSRDMSNNIFLMQAILAQDYQCPTDEADASPVAVLLDFKKAYDTLDRDFLSIALETFGYDERFVGLITRLHDNTTAQFLANGDLSDSLHVRTGIRQGCPLAPLLFLIAVETLKYAIDQTAGVRGIPLTSAGLEFQHGFSAFVDDSVVFVAEGRMLTEVENTLREFATVSGLQVQPAKSHAIVMNPHCDELAIGEFPIVPTGATVPYLGAEVGLGDTADANWAARLAKIKVQLGIASQVTTSLHDRVSVLNTIGLPAILFTAKYSTPSPARLHELDSLWRQYVWRGTISSGPIRAHKIAAPILRLPRAQMGIGLRDFREAMVDQAARTILAWNTRTHDKYWTALHSLLLAAGSTLPAIIHTYPSRGDAASARVLDGTTSLLRLGLQRVNASLVGRYPVPAAVITLTNEAIDRCEGAPGLWWLSSRVGRITLPHHAGTDWTHVGSVVYANMPHEIRSFWPTFPWYDNVWVRDAKGSELKRSSFPAITVRTLGALELRPDGHGNFLFKNPCAREPEHLRTSQRLQLVRWLRIVILHSGFHQADAESWGPGRVYSLNIQEPFHRYDWQLEVSDEQAGHGLRGRPLAEKWEQDEHLRQQRSSIEARVTGWGQAVEFLTASGSQAVHDDLLRLQDESDGKVILAGHPGIHHGPTLLHAQARFLTDRRRPDLRYGLESAQRVRLQHYRAIRHLVERLQQAHARDPELQTAVRARSIPSVQARAEGETDYQAVFRYRMTMGALNLRGNKGERLPCPHEWCRTGGAALTLTHVVLDCSAAQRTWRLIRQQWTRRSDVLSRLDSVAGSIGSDAPVLARAIRQELKVSGATLTVIDVATRLVWTIIQAVVPHHLWLHRNATAFQDAQESVHSITAKIWKAIGNQVRSIAAAKRGTSETNEVGRALDALMDGIDKDEHADRRGAVEARLYYDGGARGNPGVSGAGSLLLERRRGSEEWIPVWWATTYLGTTNTNNVAEHAALATGLEAAGRRYGASNTPLDIIGDSMLATRQLKNQIRAKEAKFQPALHRSRASLLELYDYKFHHTLRSGNKAADWLANHAMDTRYGTSSSTAPTATYATVNTALDQLILTDTSHAWTATSSFHNVNLQIAALARAHDSHQSPRPTKRTRPHALRSSTPDQRRRLDT